MFRHADYRKDGVHFAEGFVAAVFWVYARKNYAAREIGYWESNAKNCRF